MRTASPSSYSRAVWRELQPDALAYLDWEQFVLSESGLFLWEAFVTGRAKAANHVDDARAAVEAFQEALPAVADANAVNADGPMSLLSAAMLWSGWSEDIDLLHRPCLVVKAQASGRTMNAPSQVPSPASCTSRRAWTRG